MTSADILLSIASDLTAALTAEDRYRRLLEAMRRVIPFDAATLLRLEGGELSVVVGHGLKADALERRFVIESHPRLQAICASPGPIRFPADSHLPDPFDGLLENDPDLTTGIHACLGCPLHVRGELIGVLTADALDPHAFEGIDHDFLHTVAMLAAAEVHTTDLIEALERTARRRGQIAQDLVEDARSRGGRDLVGNSDPVRNLLRDIEVVAWSSLPVLVTGETGVGKELVVHAIHAASKRRDEPLLYINCAALPESLVDSELFGHVRGSFTGAVADRPGKFELADGGTLFLDEVGELPAAVQPKLLRALQQGEIQRVGADRNIRVDVRVLAATNRDLERETRAGRFRRDLFHRLAVYPIRVPTLRERPGDIPLLAGYFCDRIGRRLGLPPIRISPAVLDALAGHDWPGNVRELENLISRAVLKASADQRGAASIVLSPTHLDSAFSRAAASADPTADEPVAIEPAGSLRASVDHYQIALIRKTLSRCDNNWSAAARELGLHRANLHHLAQRLGMKE